MKIYGPQITGSLGINGSTIGNFNNLVSTSSFNQYTSSVTTGSLATTGSNTFVGNQTMSGSIIPAVTNIYDLGDVSHQFRHLYLSSGSLYINGTKVLGATGQELQITTDNGQSLKILEAGSDTITLQSADGNITLATSGGGDVILDPTSGIIALKGTTTLYAGNKLLSSDGAAIQIGNDLGITGSIITTGNINGINLTTFSSSIASTLLNQNTATSSYETKGRDIVSGSSQLTSSYDTRYVVSGSITQTTWDNIASKPSGIVSSSVQVLGGTGVISGSSQLNNASIENLTIINLTTVNETASVIFSSGSNRFGDFGNDTHEFTGSVKISGSFTLLGSSTATSYNGTINATNGVVSGSSQTIANLPTGTVSGSSQIVSILSSLNTYTASVSTGSLATTGSNTFTGTQTISASLNVSGSTNFGGAFAVNDANMNLTNSSSLNLTSGSGIYVNSPGVISGSISGIGSVTTYSASVSSQLINLNTSTSSFETKGRSIVSGSSQITYTGISSIPGGIVSGSSQTIANLPTGTVSGSSQITYANISSIPAGIVSGSSQITYTNISSIPGGIVSGSSQVDVMSTTNIARLATTGSNSFTGNQTITGTINTISIPNDLFAFQFLLMGG
jgi:hypothetical protein